MSVLTMVKNIKEIHPEYILFFKIGSFCNVYGKDAYILSYLFDYKIKNEKENVKVTGFPKNAMAKVMAKLEREKINYMIIDTRNNYDVDEKVDNKNLNRYVEVSEKSYEYVKLKVRINNIYDMLIENIDKKDEIREKIRKIEEIIYESRKV